MNWLKKISEKFEIEGWTKEQLDSDAVQVWQNGNKFWWTAGDWSKAPSSDIISSIKYYARKKGIENPEIDGDAEVGNPGKEWEALL